MYVSKNNSHQTTGRTNRLKYTALVFIGILIGSVFTVKQGFFTGSDRNLDNGIVAVAQTGSPAIPRDIPEYERAVIEATHKALPAVVSIHTYGTRNVLYTFRDPLLNMLYGGRIGEQNVSSLGSGVIIDRDGTIISNDHVINLAQDNPRMRIQVSLTDGRTFEAKLLKSFPRQDIAILSIKAKNIPYLDLGSSGDLVQGQTAIAIGNPFGPSLTLGLSGGEPTVTRGVISALKRSLTMEDTEGTPRYYRNMLQTDASINEGNSGGALIDLNGRLIGINTAIYTAGGPGSIGIGFAIPVDRVKLILDNVRNYGDIPDAFTGITVQQLTQNTRRRINLQSDSEVMIKHVDSGSPGDRAGFKPDDVIVGVNGLNVTTIEEVQNMFLGAVPGEVYTLTVYRDGSFMELNLKLGISK
ncbi:trypsin-like peptidase domain-containing protein [bacterium]|nr:trypsin-like peptidase domain-containing protein [bacterium]